ncbi:MAG: hypothetical protein NC915_06815 [Candidatus Omnitrophica bacterium]|nr:hypothetical protein [Candidatus Omnitrophota bacterium]
MELILKEKLGKKIIEIFKTGEERIDFVSIKRESGRNSIYFGNHYFVIKKEGIKNYPDGVELCWIQGELEENKVYEVKINELKYNYQERSFFGEIKEKENSILIDKFNEIKNLEKEDKNILILNIDRIKEITNIFKIFDKRIFKLIIETKKNDLFYFHDEFTKIEGVSIFLKT